MRNVVIRQRAHAHGIHSASHAEHEREAWVSISMHACGSVPTGIVLRWAALRRKRIVYNLNSCSNMSTVVNLTEHCHGLKDPGQILPAILSQSHPENPLQCRTISRTIYRKTRYQKRNQQRMLAGQICIL